jgi:hypothetical protein
MNQDIQDQGPHIQQGHAVGIKTVPQHITGICATSSTTLGPDRTQTKRYSGLPFIGQSTDIVNCMSTKHVVTKNN